VFNVTSRPRSSHGDRPWIQHPSDYFANRLSARRRVCVQLENYVNRILGQRDLRFTCAARTVGSSSKAPYYVPQQASVVARTMTS